MSLSVAYGAGGSTAGIARDFANLLGQELKQTVVVHNQPGASGTLQPGNLARARPDGYTIGFFSYSTATFTSQLMKVPYKREDFTLLGGVAEFSYGLVAAPDSPINNIKDLVAQSKTPKGVFYGVTGAPNNFPFLQLQKLTGGKYDQVTYKSSAESITAVMGKHQELPRRQHRVLEADRQGVWRHGRHDQELQHQELRHPTDAGASGPAVRPERPTPR